MSPRSLQGRLLLWVLGVVALVWLAAAVRTAFDARHELDELLDSHLAQAAALLVVQQVHELGEEEQSVDAPTLHRYAPKVAFQVFHEGQPTLRSANAPVAPMVPPDTPLDKGYATVQIAGTGWRVFTATGAEHDVRVYVGEQLDTRAAILHAVLRGTYLPLVLALPLLALAVWWAVHRGMAPLRGLSQGLAARRPQALGPVQLHDAPAELRPLVQALNGLFERIAALMESERRFTADAAHELRTPIAAIRAQAQVALAETDSGARHHALQSTLAGCDRAARLVEQLLTLSRLEAGAGLAQAPQDLAALVRREAAALAPAALDKQQTLEVQASPCSVAADATLLAVLLRNLVDNAIRYSPPGARLQVLVQAEAGGALLRVEDSGPGLPEAERRRLGERFFRALGTGESGSGLGWSIVRRIANVQGWTVRAEPSATLGGLAVTVHMPGSAAPTVKS